MSDLPMRVSYLGSSESASIIAINGVQTPIYSQGSSVDASFVEATSLHSTTTFFVRAQGDAMQNVGIQLGDILVVDRSLTARDGDIVLACVHGEMAVQTLVLQPDVLLRPKNKAYPATSVMKASGFESLGVVTNVIHQARS